MNLVRLRLANQVPDGRRGHHDLHRGHTAEFLQRRPARPLAVPAGAAAPRGRDAHRCGHGPALGPAGHELHVRQQLLRDDGFQHRRQLHANLLLLVRREDIDDPVDGLRGVGGMQRGEDQVAGLGNGQRGGDGFQVTHLAHHDDVGVLAQHSAQRVRKGLSVEPELALVDHALLMMVHVLDGILDSHDVRRALGVDKVDHRRQRRGFAVPRRAGDEDQAPRELAQVLQHHRNIQLFNGGNGLRDDARGHADRPALPVHVHTEPAQPGHRIREIELPVFLKLLLLKGVEHAVGELEGILWRQRRLACRLELAPDADHRWNADGQVQVGGLGFDRLTE